MKNCKNCKWWDEDVSGVGFCDHPKIDSFCNSWHPQDLPDWMNIKILTKFHPQDNFCCILWEQK